MFKLHLLAKFIIDLKSKEAQEQKAEEVVRFCVFSLFCCPKVSAEVLIVGNALCLHLSGPGGEGGGAAACRGADSALGSGCYRHPAG